MGVAADGWIKLAQDFISQDGRAELSTVSRNTDTPYTPAQLQSTAQTPTTYQVYCAPIDYVGKAQADGYNSIISYKQLYVPVSDNGYVPQVGDSITLGTTTYQMTKILNTFETESVECAYLVQLGV